jgi:hypothetical protein
MFPKMNNQFIFYKSNGGTIKEKKKTDRSTSWTFDIKSQLKRLAKNLIGVIQLGLRRLGIKCEPENNIHFLFLNNLFY